MIMSNAGLSMVQNLSRGTQVMIQWPNQLTRICLDRLEAKCQDCELEAESADSQCAMFVKIHIHSTGPQASILSYSLVDQ